MKVKIGNKVYDAGNEPIMIILSQADKENIKNMHDDKMKYICFPKGLLNEQEVNEFAKLNEN